MNVVFSLDFFPQIGGAHLWLYEVFRRWPQDIFFITCHYDVKCHDIYSTKTLKVLRIFDRTYRNYFGRSFVKDFVYGFRAAFNILKLLKNSSYPILFSARIVPESFYLSFLSFFKKIRIITFAHGEEFTSIRTSRLLSLYAKFAFRKTDLFIANSFFTKNLILKDFGNTVPVDVIHLGVDYNKYQVNKEKIKKFIRSKDLYDNSTILFTISRLEPRKNHTNVMLAIKKLIALGYPIKYIVAGEGSYKDHLVSFANKLGLEKYVHFWGAISESEKILAFNASDIFVMPSIQIGPDLEGFGIVFMEAAAAGVPSIAGNVGGQPEAVIHAKTGLVVDGTNVKEIADAIQYLIEKPNIRKYMGQEAKKWARQHDWNYVARVTYNRVSEYF